jgi:branched-chain amino acid transport system ATP-binding protein
MLRVEGLCAGYGDVQVLHDVSLTAGDGETVALVGANGAGKSTFLRALTGLIPSFGGSIVFKGESIAGLPAHTIVERGLIMVPEGRALFPFMTVLENLELGSFSRRARSQRGGSLTRVFDLMPRLAERRGQLAGSLSGGEQQMCAIARGLMARPDLLLLDEPSIGLAPIVVHEVFRLIGELRRDGIPVLLVEQHIRHALGLADRGIVIQNGRVALIGTSDELLSDRAVQHAFLGGRQIRGSI